MIIINNSNYQDKMKVNLLTSRVINRLMVKKKYINCFVILLFSFNVFSLNEKYKWTCLMNKILYDGI